MADIFDNVVRDLAAELGAAVNGIRVAEGFASKCQSPIELAFAATLSLMATLDGLDVRWARDSYVPPDQYFVMEPQAVIGEYRVDFLCAVVDPRGFRLAESVVVECDGHAWHERTAEQAARDKARDRFLQTQVAKVLHFTGSELFRAPGKCARETLDLVGQVYMST